MYLYSNEIDPDALAEINWGEPIESEADMISVIADIIMDNALVGVKDFSVKDGPNGYPRVSIWGKDIDDVIYAVNEIWYAGEASDDDMEDIMDLIVQTNKVPNGVMLSGEAFEESKKVKKPFKAKKMKEAAYVPQSTKTFGLIKLVFKNLREKGYEYSVCGCYLGDAKNYYYEFLEDDWEQMEDNCIKKIIGYAFAKDNNLPLDSIVSSVKELLKNGTNGIRDVITEGFEEVAI